MSLQTHEWPQTKWHARRSSIVLQFFMPLLIPNQLQFQDYEMYLAGATAAQNHYYNPFSQYTAGPGGHQHYYDEAGHPQYGRTSRGKRRGRKENAPSDAELDKTYTGLDR